MVPGVQGDGNKVSGGAGGAAGPATTGNVGANFSANGWTVSTGSSKASGGNAATGSIPWWAYLAGGALLIVGVVAWKKYS